ncbi:MAG TPA: transcriptional repressor NrdR, partial [candidate division Zixibacteria bacterium]|nr:transcriptional repressor NrdR [candidate division Zixibacteria bacterium]
MRCPFCGHQEDKVVDSRTAQDGRAVRRRRECLGCGRRFTTYEYVENLSLSVVKRNQARELYDRTK